MNGVSSDQRRYELKARAVRQRRTRQRIIAATAALHREVGPARTTIVDVARRAGVQRLTVYNHFPVLQDLLGACQQHFLTRHPPPDLMSFASGDKGGGLDAALVALYSWYRAHRSIEHNVHRDRHLIPELDELMRANADPQFDAAASAHAEVLGTTPASVEAASCLIRVALEFSTWELLADRGMADADIARLLWQAATCTAKEGVPS
ncbi:MAG: helix-turn-helix transcriptional regulator [Candidatus Dormibacteraeota bacterium]|nr:helix-turn-helix transcriptional regulator [Candidatus Dormibacteraeota bacterium]